MRFLLLFIFIISFSSFAGNNDVESEVYANGIQFNCNKTSNNNLGWNPFSGIPLPLGINQAILFAKEQFPRLYGKYIVSGDKFAFDSLDIDRIGTSDMWYYLIFLTSIDESKPMKRFAIPVSMNKTIIPFDIYDEEEFILESSHCDFITEESEENSSHSEYFGSVKYNNVVYKISFKSSDIETKWTPIKDDIPLSPEKAVQILKQNIDNISFLKEKGSTINVETITLSSLSGSNDWFYNIMISESRSKDPFSLIVPLSGKIIIPRPEKDR